MNFCPRSYRRALADYARNWRLQDQTLRRLCREHPTHDDGAAVRAKLWIIGRTFATGVERTVTSDQTQGSSASRLAQLLTTRHKSVDAIIAPLSGSREPLTVKSLRAIIAAHGRLLKLL